MKNNTENPNEVIVNDCCKNCPLLPSKPGNDTTTQNILAAANSANRLKKLVDGKLAEIVFRDPNELSARRVSAYLGFLNAENKSERNRLKKFEQEEEPKGKIKFKPTDGF